MTTQQGGREREAFVLGAGFSKAISAEMPLTDELGRRLAAEDPATFGSLGSRSFEAWLSQRAEPQPYLDAAENLQRQAVSWRASDSIARLLDVSVSRALADPLKRWVGELPTLWHLNENHVLTFNYDPLVECAFDTLQFWDWRRDTRFPWGSLINDNPSGMAGMAISAFNGSGGPHRSFKLWKLHGSTNWFWSPGDMTGASALRGRLPGLFGEPRGVGEDERHWVAPGRERLLVPPSAQKSTYYANPVTRETWSRGFEALAAAEVITLVGYSLPQTDLTTAGMLSEAMESGSVREIRVVDYDPDPIVDRIRSLAPANVEIAAHGTGETAVSEYVSGMLAGSSRAAVAEIREFSHDDLAEWRIVVTWGDLGHGVYDRPEDYGRTAAVVGIGPTDNPRQLRLVAEPVINFEGATVARADGKPRPLPLAELQRRLDGVEEVVVCVPGVSGPVTVVASTSRRSNLGEGDGTWLQLVPAGQLVRT